MAHVQVPTYSKMCDDWVGVMDPKSPRLDALQCLGQVAQVVHD